MRAVSVFLSGPQFIGEPARYARTCFSPNTGNECHAALDGPFCLLGVYLGRSVPTHERLSAVQDRPRVPGMLLTGAVPLELFQLGWNQLSTLLCRIFDGEPDPLRRKML